VIDTTNPVSVVIMDKEYRIACEEEERDSLLASARLLDARMREIRRAGRVIGAERIAVMAALNIAHELLQQRNSRHQQGDTVTKRLRELEERIERALNTTNQLEL
jgi:cell division protein ZapA